jgi:hypothetical protein
VNESATIVNFKGHTIDQKMSRFKGRLVRLPRRSNVGTKE